MVHKKVAAVDKLRSTANGNPMFKVTFTDGTSAKTAIDTGDAFKINSWADPGRAVDVTFDNAGHIIGWDAVEAAS